MKRWTGGAALFLGLHLLAGGASARTLQVGPGGYSTIGQALAAATFGDVVLVAPGTYREAVHLKSGVTLRGAGEDRTTIEGPMNDNVLEARNIQGAVVEGLRFVYRGTEPHAAVLLVDSRVEMRNVGVTGATLSGVEVKGSGEVRISDSRIYENKQTGAFAHAGARLFLLRTRLIKNGYHGATAGKDAFVSLRQNRIEDNQKAGIVAYEKGRVEAVSNFILRNQTIGVDLFEGATGELRANVIAKNKLHGVRINDTPGVAVSFNTVVDNGEVGLWAKTGAGVTLTSNIVVGNKWGISDDKNPGPRPILRNNLVWENRWNYDPSTLRPGPGDIAADPRFVNRAGGNYRLLAGSPAIARGDGGRELGAWRFAAGPPRPPVVAGALDPERASGANRTREGALPHDFNGSDTGTVDYNAGDRTDWWKLSVREPGQMVFRLENLSGTADIDMEVYRGNEATPQGASRRAGTATEEASLAVEPGLYYIRVWAPGPSGTIRYRLSNSFTARAPTVAGFLDPERNSGSNRDRAGALPHNFNGADTGDVDYNGGDRTDWWKLPIAEAGQVTFRLENLLGTGDIDMEIYRESEPQPRAYSRRAGTATEEATLAVEPGTYNIRVWAPGPSGKISYRLSNRFTPRLEVARPPTPPGLAPPPVPPGDVEGPKIEVSYPDRSPITVSERELVVTGLVRDPSGISRVKVLLNGRDLPYREGVQGCRDPEMRAGGLVRDFDLNCIIPLRKGTNVVIITAFDRAENASKKVLQVSYQLEAPQVERPQIAGVPTPPKPAAPRAAVDPYYKRKWAVVVGIDRYQSIPPLNYAVNDARRMRDRLAAMGYEVTFFQNEAATKDAILGQLMDQLPGRVGPEDSVLIFFSGHGETRTFSGGTKLGYILPVEGRFDQLASTAISMTNIKDISDALPAKHVLFVMDACYSGVAFRSFRDIGVVQAALGSGPEAKRALKRLSEKRVRQLITAGKEKEKVVEVAGSGLFTNKLLDGLSGEADSNEDGVITFQELAKYVQIRVQNESAALGSRHVPQFGNLDGEGEFLFVSPKAR